MKVICSILSALCLVSCTKEIEFAFPESSSQIVLNGVINPDSLIRVSLTQALSVADSQDFPAVTDATVRLYEDDRMIGSLVFEGDVYIIDYYPQVNKRYTIEAEIDGYGTISASDMVPLPPTVSACYKKADFLDGFLNYAGVQITLRDDAAYQDYYWFNMSVSRYGWLDSSYCVGKGAQRICTHTDSSDVSIEQLSPLVSTSTVPDNFNSFVDNTSGGVRQFDVFLRVEDQAVGGTDLTMDISSYSPMYRLDEMSRLDSNQSAILEAVNASRHYDRYLKSSMIYYLNNEFDSDDPQPNPFAEPTRIYSNVENGLGIFAAYNSVSIPVEDFPCE